MIYERTDNFRGQQQGTPKRIHRYVAVYVNCEVEITSILSGNNLL